MTSNDLGGRTAPDRPVLKAQLFGRAALEDPLPQYAAIRAAGPAVWLPRHRVWAVGRYHDVKTALRTPGVFASGRGVGLNPITNRLSRGTVLNSDGADHARRRSVMLQSLSPRRLDDLEQLLDDAAERMVSRLVGLGTFDGVKDFASALPIEVVSRLVGLRAETPRLLRWGAATFDVLGPAGHRAAGALPRGLSMLVATKRLRAAHVQPGSWAASVFDAADRGELTRAEAKSMVIDFVTPSLDTTILATAHLLWLLAAHPQVWSEIRADPALIPGAVAEAVRLASPLKAFSRYVAEDTELGGVQLPAGSRVLLIYASANRDERRFPEPDTFDIRRRPGQQIGWGFGPHACAGMGLAKLEMQAILKAMVPRVERITTGTPIRLRNNTLQGLAALPAAFV